MSILDPNEASVRGKVKSYAKSRGWIVIPVDHSGWPDDVFISPTGTHVWIEFKRPKGGRHKLRQKHRLGTLQGSNCNAFLVNTVERGKEIVDLYQTE